MGGKSGPKQDPRIGEAAMKSAATGEKYLDWMREQADITNKWATEDRSRYKTVFEPLQDDYIARAKGWDTPERQAAAAAEARADVLNNADMAEQQRKRTLAAMGVTPDSGRYAGVERSADIATGLAAAGAENSARKRIRAEGMELRGNAVNIGSNLAVNPLSSATAATGAMASGFSGAMNGYGQQANILNQDYQNRLQAWQAKQANAGAMWQGVGGLVGLAFGSDEDIKENKRKPRRSLLKAVNDMRVEEWDYKPGEGDGGSHVGTYAQDFKKTTGRGDGKRINVIDAIGVTMGAVKELSEKVDRMAAKPRRRSVMAAA